MKTILQGIVGSQAYGLAREGSDVDRLGIFVAPTLDVAGLHWNSSRQSRVTMSPDITLHELGKFLALALRMNPTVVELLWLPRPLYETWSTIGRDLIDIRSAFVSERYVRASYGGYARSQAEKLAARGDSFSSETKNRTVKHARHMLRLLRQGRELLETGVLTIELADPSEYFAFDDMTPEQMLQVFADEDAKFQAAHSVLPVEANLSVVDDFLAQVRRTHLQSS